MVNDVVDRETFDDTPFTLKFPTVDDILDRDRLSKGRVLLSKLDIARAFRNLHVYPVEDFRYDIQGGVSTSWT